MAVKGATQEDLKTLELRINKEQTDLRHADRNKMQGIVDEVDDLKIGHALNNQSMTAMQKDIEEMKKLLKEFIEKCDTKFVTKDEYKFAMDRVEKAEVKIKENDEKFGKINTTIAYASGFCTLAGAGITFIAGKFF